MSEHDELTEPERRMLGRARRALSPAAADAERVLAATLAAVTAPASIEAPTISSSSAARRGPGVTSALLRRLLATLAIAGASGGIGYWVGLRAGQTSRPRDLPGVAAAPEAPEAPDSQELASPVPERLTVAQEPVERLPARPAPRKRGPSEAPPPATEQALAPPEKPGLAAELAAVKQIERALRDGEPGVALQLLDQLDEVVPDGLLGEERLAASVMARCAMGLGSRGALRHEFANRYPSSAYLERIAAACRRDEPSR